MSLDVLPPAGELDLLATPVPGGPAAVKPDLLFLTQRLPYPPIKGEKIRAFNELKYLSQWYNIHLGCLIDDPDDVQYIETIREMCCDVYVVRINKRFGRLFCLRGLLTGDALSVSYFRDRGLLRWVRHLVKSVKPVVLFVNSSNMVPYVIDLRNVGIKIVDLVDVDSEKWRTFSEVTKGPLSLVYRREWQKIARLEQRIARECDFAALVSGAEARLYSRQNRAARARIRGVSNGVDHRFFDPHIKHPPVFDTTHPNYVFTGTMDYPPNADAVLWFANEILTVIRRAFPFACFHIVGSNPNREVIALERIHGVFVTGRVPDVRPFIAHATASVAPMRIARGIQNKVLEAMAMGRPVVLTSAALEGIDADPVTETICADTVEAFAAACCRMAVTNDGVAIGAAARARILADYDWESTLRGFDDVLKLTGPEGAWK